MKPQFTIIVPTRDRHKQLITTLHAIAAQVGRSSAVEVIVSVDGPDTGERSIVEDFQRESREAEAGTLHFSVLTSERPKNDWGATPRDAAIAVAAGTYLLFWDDDNVYCGDALHRIEQVAIDADILVYRTRHWHQKKTTVIPRAWKGAFAQSDIDTMCVCVRADVARRAAWATEGRPRDCDYRWLKRLVDSGAVPVFHDLLIGEHL